MNIISRHIHTNLISSWIKVIIMMNKCLFWNLRIDITVSGILFTTEVFASLIVVQYVIQCNIVQWCEYNYTILHNDVFFLPLVLLIITCCFCPDKVNSNLGNNGAVIFALMVNLLKIIEYCSYYYCKKYKELIIYKYKQTRIFHVCVMQLLTQRQWLGRT